MILIKLIFLTRKLKGVKEEYYSKDIIDYAKENPVFVHFMGYTYAEIWSIKNYPYRSLYEKYSEFAGFKEELIKKDAVLPLYTKLVYNSNHNPFFKLILKIIPTYFIHKKIHHIHIKFFKSVEKT